MTFNGKVIAIRKYIKEFSYRILEEYTTEEQFKDRYHSEDKF